MTKKKIQPRLLYCDQQGHIYDHPHLLMLCRKGKEFFLPRPEDLIALPQGSDILQLPCRKALGFDPDNGRLEYVDAQAVAAFVCPGFTLTAWSAFLTDAGSAPLPLFSYAAVGFAQGRFWVCASQVDSDPRQKFGHIHNSRIREGARNWLGKFPKNPLVGHLAQCALSYNCPAAKNLALGRYEAPLPTARHCNAACIGCISWQPKGSPIPVTQNRINFTPSVNDITQIMHQHANNEKKPIFSFGQGCEGEPLTETELIKGAITAFRQENKQGTININTNGSRPEDISRLAAAGLNSIRVTLISAREDIYTAYHRPKDYQFRHIKETIQTAKEKGLFVSLNYLFAPGISDSEEEVDSLLHFMRQAPIDFLQLRNLNLDPELYLDLLPDSESPGMGLKNFQYRLQKSFPWIRFGYFNPWLIEGNKLPD